VQAATKLLIFDAIDYGLAPGTLKLIENDEVPRFMGAKKMSLHQTGFQEVLMLAQLTEKYPRAGAADRLPARRAGRLRRQPAPGGAPARWKRRWPLDLLEAVMRGVPHDAGVAFALPSAMNRTQVEALSGATTCNPGENAR
jgi:hypothetical protein